MESLHNAPAPGRGVYCNRTLNMRSIKVIGYDMDYTLIHYHVTQWERRAYEDARQRFLERGWPVAHLTFDPELVIRGLIIDTDRGNLLKANRFGFVKKAIHGTRSMTFEEQREAYSRTIVDLHEPRWVFLNTLFSLSEGCIYAQLVDLLDKKLLPEPMGYVDLYEHVRAAMDATHVEGKLKAEIIANPDPYVLLEPDTALTLLDQKNAGKKLMLITNSEWGYTSPMMHYAFDRFMPPGMTWRDLFDVIIVGARKPDFFTTHTPIYEVATEEGLLRPGIRELRPGVAYQGGSASFIERSLRVSGDEVLYVGDHMFGDVNVTKNVLRWRTALVLRELEDEIIAIQRFQATEAVLAEKMRAKEEMEDQQCQLRLALQRKKAGYGPPLKLSEQQVVEQLSALRGRMEAVDHEIGPLAKAATELSNPVWGLLTRAGNDKSHLARQMERYADIYTSRVSNLLYATPFVYLRSPRGSLPHDPTMPGGTPTMVVPGSTP
jgi:HAD superfamily 5'-nucleotidase-like hydrolase